MAKMGRPRKTINWEEFDKLVSMQCTQIEIAAFFDVSVDFLEEAAIRDRGETLPEIWAKKKLMGKVRLRKAQFAIAEGKGPGAAVMAIFLDKKMNPLEQPEVINAPHQIKNITPDGKKTFEEFCATADYPKPFEKQIEMKSFALDAQEPSLILGSRGYGKTDYVTILAVAYDIYLDANSTNLIITKSKSRNTAIIEEISHALQKNGVKLEKENSRELRVEGLQGKDHSVEALTIRSSLRGRHPKRIIMDDPVTEEDVSEAMRELVKRKYDESYKLCKRIVIIGQPAHVDDLYAEMRPRLKKLEIPHGQIPELDADLIAMEIAGVDPKSIEMSYHLRIPKSGSSIFANIKYIDALPQGDSVAFIDPSDGGDFTAISCLRGYMDGVAVEGYVWKKAWYHCLDEIVEVLKKCGVRRLCFETNFTGTQPLEQLRELLKPLAIGVVGKHSDSNKHACIVSAGSYSHLIHLSRRSCSVYTKHVTKYEYKSKFDDAPDSLARGLEWLGLIRGKK